MQRRVSASTHHQALCALVFLDRHVLELEMLSLEGLERARCPDHLPAVLSRRDVLALLDRLEPPFRLLGEILYGSGLRLLKCLSVLLGHKDVRTTLIYTPIVSRWPLDVVNPLPR